MSKPDLVFVPGYWEGPTIFNHITNLLTTSGYTTHITTNPSTGSTSPGNPTINDDINSVRSIVQPLVEDEGKEIVLVMHSAGGIIGSAAVEGLVLEKRKEEGKKGGVKYLIFIAAGVQVLGEMIGDLPFMDYSQGDRMFCVNPRNALFNDLSDGEAEKWMNALQCQPGHGSYHQVINYGAWNEIASTYLICETDQILPVEVQKYLATLAGAKIESCSAGHSPMLSQPDVVVELIKRLAV